MYIYLKVEKKQFDPYLFFVSIEVHSVEPKYQNSMPVMKAYVIILSAHTGASVGVASPNIWL